jgi:hypothetical protein
MDDHCFDNLTRLLATHRSRRSFFRAAAGAAAAGLLALPPAARPTEAAAGRPKELKHPRRCHAGWPSCGDGCCSTNQICVGGTGCAPAGAVPCGAGYCAAGRLCTADGLCARPDPCTGVNCDDGDPCTTDSCVHGVCQHLPIAGCCTADAQCQTGDPCSHDTCDPATATCVHAPVANCCRRAADCPPLADPCRVATCTDNQCGTGPAVDGTACDDGDACTRTDTCQGGVCTGGDPVVCTAADQCHVAGTCDPATGACSNPTAPDGSACDDANPCTVGDACRGGACVGDPVTCQPLDACHDAGVCDTTTGTCTNPPKADGTSCSDGNACTQTDTCQGGVCTGANPVVCAPPNECQETGTCDAASGQCVYQPKPDDTPCTGNDQCFQTYACKQGVCTGSIPVVCTASDQCHVAGTCNPATGTCSNSQASDGTACDDGNPCTYGDTCQGGVCTAGQTNPCFRLPIPGYCTNGLVCDGHGGCLEVDPNPDGTPCTTNPDPCQKDSTCQAGKCVGTPYTCPPDPGCHFVRCDAKGGCVTEASFARRGEACDDGNPCTFADVCTLVPPAPGELPSCYTEGATGLIVCGSLECHGTFQDCGTFVDDDCREQVCDGHGGCTKTARSAPDGTICPNDDDPCTLRSACQGGVCTHQKYTCPNDVCAQGFCIGGGQCGSDNTPDGGPCGTTDPRKPICYTHLTPAPGYTSGCVPFDSCHPDGVCQRGACVGTTASVGTLCYLACADPSAPTCSFVIENAGSCDAVGVCQPGGAVACGNITCGANEPHCCGGGGSGISHQCCDHECTCIPEGCACL